MWTVTYPYRQIGTVFMVVFTSRTASASKQIFVDTRCVCKKQKLSIHAPQTRNKSIKKKQEQATYSKELEILIRPKILEINDIHPEQKYRIDDRSSRTQYQMSTAGLMELCLYMEAKGDR